MNEITVHQQNGALEAQMQFAQTVATTNGSILPKAYQGNPANALVAINLGASMGLGPAESLYRIAVIQGTPSASAELIASNVRKAGHKLRVHVNEQAKSVTAQIIRHDDPDYTYEVTRDMAWAQQMGLAGKDNYKMQPLTMLQWRAITAVARLAASEALYGVGHTADELRESPTVHGTTTDRVSAADFAPKKEEAPAGPSDGQVKKMWAAFRHHIAEEQQRAFIEHTIGHSIESSKNLTADEVSAVIDRLEQM